MVYRSPHNQDEGDLQTGTRVCRTCDLRHPMTEFYFANGGKHRRRVCKTCVDVRFKERRAANPERYARQSRRWSIRTKYGLTEEQFEALLMEQQYRCQVCRVKLTKDITNVDHDHATNQVRGLLCFNCNVAIGHFRDDPNLMEAAASYVRVARRLAALDADLAAIDREIEDLLSPQETTCPSS